MAARDVVAELSVNLTMETAAFASGASAAEARAKTLEGRMSSLGSRAKSVGGALTGLAGGFLAGVGIQTITGAIASGLEYASSLGEVAQQLGVTTTALQTYRYAATQVGLSQDEMDASLARLTRSIGDASNGTGPAAKAFQQLGISLRDSNGNLLSTERAMPLIAEALTKVQDPAQKAAILVDLFGKSGQKLLPLLSEGARGIDALNEAAKKTGTILTPEQIAKADEAMDKWAAYKQILSSEIAIGAVTGLEKLEAFNAFMDRMAAHVAGEINAIKASFAGFGRGVEAQVQSLKSAFTTMGNVAVSAVRNMVAGIRNALTGGLTATFNAAKAQIESLRQSFFNLWDKVTRRSYIPDMVDDISRQMDRLQPEMLGKATRAIDATANRFSALRDEVRSLMEQLFPEERDLRDYRNSLATIARGEAAGMISGPVAEEARRRAGGIEEEPISLLAEPMGNLSDTIRTEVLPAFNQLGERSMSLGDKFQTTLDSIMGIVATLFPNSKKGRILGAILQGGLDIAKAFGAFGGGRANGGPVVPGKTYLVGERGPEFASFGRKGYVSPPKGGGAPTRLQVVPSPFFELVVDNRAAGVAAPMAGRAAVAGAAGSIRSIQQQQRRALP